MKHRVIILFFILIFLFYIFNTKIFENKETFLTYYLPFYNVESSLLNNFYKYHNYNKNYFKHKIDFNKLVIGSSPYSFIFNKIISRIIINKTLNNEISSIIIKNRMKSINLLYENKINLLIVNLLLISEYNQKYSNRLDTMYVISNLYKSYLIVMTKLKYNIYSLDKIPYQTKIGILNEEDSIYFYINKLLKDLNYKKDDMKIIIYNSLKELHKGLLNDEVNVIIHGTSLPNNELASFINYDYTREIIIIPFKLEQQLQESFLAKNSFFEIDTFDLNQISASYLPKKFSNYYYFTYKPDMPILSYQHYLITNNKIDNETVSNITSVLLENISAINNILPTEFKIERIGPRPNISRYILYNPTTLKIFEKYGYITNNSNPNCKLLVGVKECTNKTLENNGLLLK